MGLCFSQLAQCGKRNGTNCAQGKYSDTKDSKAVLKYLHETYENQIYISIMHQFTPLSNVKKYPELNRKITDREYDEVVDFAIDIGIENGFIQEGETAEESFIPEFDNEGV